MPRFLARHLVAVAYCLVAAARAQQVPASSPAAAPGREHDLRREHVLGTSFQLLVEADDQTAADAMEGAALAEIERLAAILSSHQADSELCASLAGKGPARAAPELIEVLQACARWHAASQGAFQPGVELATRRWRQAEKDDTLPSAGELDALAVRLRELPWQLDAKAGRVSFAPEAAVNLDALAKGYIVDRALRAAGAIGKGKPMLLAIGGDLVIAAGTPRTIAIVDPRAPADNAAPLCQLRLDGRAVASSGGYRRGFRIGGQAYSHIIDPRTARPAAGVLGASVVAADCATADALATILGVLSPQDGLQLVASVADAACLIVDHDGRVHRSAGWNKLEVETADVAADTRDIAQPMQLHVDFEINQVARAETNPNGEGRSRRGRGPRATKRPYVAVWLETTDGKPVRTLCLWIENRRWLSDLQRWHRLHRGQHDFIDAVSQATRKPGAYDLVWDGKNDDGQPVPPGDLVLVIEAAREHGTYQIMRQPLQLGSGPFTHALEGNVEIKSATVWFAAKKPQ